MVIPVVSRPTLAALTPTSPDTASPPPAPIEAREVVKSYQVDKKSVEILHGVSMRVNAQEMVAVMGPSGSGKSTLLYCLAGLEAPTAGEVSLAGRLTQNLSKTELAKLRRREVGFVFQSYNLLPTLTAFENVALPYRLRGDKPPVDLIIHTLTTVGLAERVHARPPSMSGGEQQRVALARVLAQQPRIVFADEPTGALDTASGELVLSELNRLAHHPQRCVCVVTHDPQVAATCDRVLFMRDGLLVTELVSPTVDAVASTLTSLSGGDRS